MQSVLDAVLEIDILLPPREYLTELLRVLCAHFAASCGLVLAHDAGAAGGVLAQHAAPGLLIEPLVAYSIGLAPALDSEPLCRRLSDTLLDTGMRQVVVVPLRYQEDALGSLLLYRSSDAPLDDVERLLLRRTAEMTAVAIVSNTYLGQLDQRTRAFQQEIAERKRMEAALREALRARRDLEDIVSHSPLVVMRCRMTEHWPIDFVTESVGQFGFVPEDFLEGRKALGDLIHASERTRVLHDIARHLAEHDDEFVLEFRLATPRHAPRWVECRFWGRRDTDAPDVLHILVPPVGRILYLQGVMLEITERKQAEEVIRHQAFHDTLTDLPNRTLFQDRLQHALVRARRHGTRLAVMFLDLDRFKTINDTLWAWGGGQTAAGGGRTAEGAAARGRYRVAAGRR